MELASLLIRRRGLLIFNLQLIHNLLNIRNGCRDVLRLYALGLRVHLAGQGNHLIVYGVIHILVKLPLNERGICTDAMFRALSWLR